MDMIHYLFATDEEKEIGEGAYEIAAKKLAPIVEKCEAADGGLGKYPREIHDLLVENGYFAVDIPEVYGGVGLNAVTQGLIIEKLGEVDAGFAFAFASASAQWSNILKTHMPDAEKKAWIEKVLNGAIGAFGLTESEAGSDPAAMRTTAKYDAKTDEWVLNGTKCFCSGAPNAEYFVIMAWTDKTQRPSRGITAFFIEKERGVKIGKKENKLGLHLSETADVILEDVRVPSDHIIGEVNRGFGFALGDIKTASGIVNCCPILGSAQAALDYAVEYAKTRRQFGKRIIDHQGVGFQIAEMSMKLAAARAMTYEFLEACDKKVDDQNLSLKIKAYVSDTCFDICNTAIQVLGGYGYMHDFPVERYMRNARIFQIFGGTNEIKKKNLAKAIAGKDPEKAKK